jgi:protein-tyrosine phosphatase
MPRTDLHCHILPGVDDGPRTMEESLAYAEAAVAAGTATVVATPHVELVDVRELPDRVDELRGALRDAAIDLEVQVGGELKPMSVPELDQDDLEVIAHGPPGARWLLFEVPFHGFDEDFHAAAAELRDRGFGLLLAHPERSAGILRRGLGALESEVRRGALVAANVDPLQGGEGPDREAAAASLLRRGVPTVVATDAHAPRRPFTLAMGHEAVARVTGRADLARRLTQDAPARLLAEGIVQDRRAA